MPKKKKQQTKNISEIFDFTAQNMYDTLCKLINKCCTEDECNEIIDKLDKFIDYIYMYW